MQSVFRNHRFLHGFVQPHRVQKLLLHNFLANRCGRMQIFSWFGILNTYVPGPSVPGFGTPCYPEECRLRQKSRKTQWFSMVLVAWTAKIQYFSLLLTSLSSALGIQLKFHLVCLGKAFPPSRFYIFYWPFFACILLQTYGEQHGGAFWLQRRNSFINALRPMVNRFFQDSWSPRSGFVKARVVQWCRPFRIQMGSQCERHLLSHVRLMIYMVSVRILFGPILDNFDQFWDWNCSVLVQMVYRSGPGRGPNSCTRTNET